MRDKEHRIPTVFLVGLSGSGKTTVGSLLARRLGIPFRDTDEEVERQAGRPIAEIFDADGEAVFRALERAALMETCGSAPVVVASGGGAVLDASNRAAMQQTGTVLWLDAPSSVLAERLSAAAGATRPLLRPDPFAALERLRRERQHLYALCGRRIDTHGHTPEEVMEEIMAALGADASPFPAEGATVVWVRAGTHVYPAYVGSGLLQHARRLLTMHGLNARLHVIADERVSELYGSILQSGLGDMPYTWHLVPSGETHKNLHQVHRLYDELLPLGLERNDVVLAFGGGVIGDLAGFLAATLLRGLRWVQVPSTLLAQVDSSVGGKVGVDHVSGKNLIGAFHQPHLVIADYDLLATLPPRDIAAGWAEVVKIAVMRDAALFEQLESAAPALRGLDAVSTHHAITRAIELKAELVEQDERDTLGLRALLNYGHTIGHALEATLEYEGLLHGEAVAIGMAGAAHVAQQLGLLSGELVSRQTELLQAFWLPQRYPGVSRAELRRAMGLDKKRSAGQITWVLPTGLGAGRSGVLVPREMVDEALSLVTSEVAH